MKFVSLNLESNPCFATECKIKEVENEFTFKC